jgi:hypothetical protein
MKSILLFFNSNRFPASDLYESNKTFLKMLSDGFILKREDRNQKDIYIQLINYTGLNKHRQPERTTYFNSSRRGKEYRKRHQHIQVCQSVGNYGT